MNVEHHRVTAHNKYRNNNNMLLKSNNPIPCKTLHNILSVSSNGYNRSVTVQLIIEASLGN